ncbi:MAG: putative toxin-antitoxin system toxin component, PIN family [Prevotella sp.]|nr:putative toxin-antitoxin system toxin component, PIN family [Prevotella sp.]
MIYAVIDTNVIVSAMLTRHSDAATAKILNAIIENEITALYNDEIIQEYKEVLHRKKFGFPKQIIDKIIERIHKQGISTTRTQNDEVFPDPKDVVFYEVAMSKEDAYLVTGNIKHFPQKPIIVTPAEMLEILQGRQT